MSPKKTSRGTGPLEEIQGFYRFMVEQKLETLEYDHEGLHVRLVRQRPASVPVPVPVGISPSAPSPAGSAASATSSLPPGAITLKAPMMGIFYRASSPSSPPFVRKGEVVKKGQVLCLIEAMKVFNEVKAEFDCTVLDILLENGKPVKAGQEILAVQRA